MAKKTTFCISVTGTPYDRAALIGGILLYDISRISTVSHEANRETIHFRFRGDARFALRRASRMLTGKDPKPADRLEYNGAVATVAKTPECSILTLSA